ncbi:MAG: phosphoribosylglycinamide formyltransferase [Pseudomonadales bacterium]
MNPPLRIVVLISGSGSNLQSLIDDAKLPGSLYDIVAVLSNKPEAYGLERAAKAHIDQICIKHQDFPDRESFDSALVHALEGYQPDLVILAGFMRILTASFVSRFKGKLLNIHPSLLPKYPGLHTHQRAIDAGDSEAGCTVHFVTEDLDGGPPILQAKVPVLANDSPDLLATRVLAKEHLVYPLVARWFARTRVELQGDNALIDQQPIAESGLIYDQLAPDLLNV